MKNTNGKNRTLILACFASFPLYILFNNLVNLLDKVAHANHPMNFSFYFLGLFCKSRPPITDNDRYFLGFILLKYLLLILALILTHRKNNIFSRLLKLEFILFFVIDLYTGISILIDSYASTELSLYFFSSAFMMGFSKVYFGHFALVPLLNGIVGLALIRYTTGSWQSTLRANLFILLSVCFSCLFFYLILLNR